MPKNYGAKSLNLAVIQYESSPPCALEGVLVAVMRLAYYITEDRREDGSPNA